ncbi:Inositol hexakisphosphate and diphosphoinositol-pentakisphosphate kinase 1 [Takifugu flavidus]|uniref:Inositol hexakisphosphate and diphosphoinositol-pentakisphosphate kinase 1 n=1 Tax=Takifugu flavidus TaxID=433684 RepID=A0A5C6P9C2_9TELE|nr:Inositol hexakisphosphate and diphosphoinositol-pentakisphosphate kinase 1 [Takifugu flavidus]
MRVGTPLRTAKYGYWPEKTERGIKEAIHVKLEKTSLNRGGGLRPFLSPTYNAVLHSFQQQTKRSYHFRRPGDSPPSEPADKEETPQPKLELFSMPPVKRFSVSFARHPTNGFEGCSMVPSIYPLETLHNSLSLKQVDDFLNRVCESSSEAHAKTMKVLSSLFDSQSQSLYSPQRPLSSSGSETSLRPPSQKVWNSSIPSSAVSSAGPPSPVTESSSLDFTFND